MRKVGKYYWHEGLPYKYENGKVTKLAGQPSKEDEQTVLNLINETTELI